MCDACILTQRNGVSLLFDSISWLVCSGAKCYAGEGGKEGRKDAGSGNAIDLPLAGRSHNYLCHRTKTCLSIAGHRQSQLYIKCMAKGSVALLLVAHGAS